MGRGGLILVGKVPFPRRPTEDGLGESGGVLASGCHPQLSPPAIPGRRPSLLSLSPHTRPLRKGLEDERA
jgi:hypothetical protein